MAKEKCGLKRCFNNLGPGAAAVGFDNEGQLDEVRVCAAHAYQIMCAPRGTFFITPDRELKNIPAQPKIII